MAENNYTTWQQIRRFIDPAFINTTFSNSEKITPKLLGNDLLHKLVGGAAIAVLLEGGRRTLNTGDKKEERKRKKAIKDYISTKYISIPSETETDVIKEINKEKTAQDNDEGNGVWGAVETMDEAGEWLWLSLTNPEAAPAWYLPVSIATMMAGFYGGQKWIGGRANKKRVKELEEDTEKINKDIGRLVQQEYHRTREKTAQEETAQSFWSDPLGRMKKLFTTLVLIGSGTGLILGWMKGRQENAANIMNKQLTKVIRENQSVTDAPQVLVPKSLTQSGIKPEKSTKSQESVPVEDLYV